MKINKKKLFNKPLRRNEKYNIVYINDIGRSTRSRTRANHNWRRLSYFKFTWPTYRPLTLIRRPTSSEI